MNSFPFQYLPNIIYMEGMFKDCANLKNVVLTSFDTSGVMNMKLMFSRDYQIQSLDLRNLDTSSVTNM